MLGISLPVTVRVFLVLSVPGHVAVAETVAARCAPTFTPTKQTLAREFGNGAAAWCDFNNDGWVDLHTGGAVWLNRKGRTFERIAAPGKGVAADFDNDGWVDIFSWSHLRLLRNLAGVQFTRSDAVALPKSVSRGACWGDFDNDGYVDIYAGGYEDWQAGVTYPDRLLHNDTGRHFAVVWQAGDYRARGVTACDFDEDCDMDVYVSNYRLQPNVLLVNDGKGNFQDMAGPLNARATSPGFRGGHSIGACWADFDNDGHFDLFAGNFAHRDHRGDQPESRFLRNGGPTKGYQFTDRGPCGVFYQESYATCAAGDYDNDGDVDLYVTTVYATASFGRKNYSVLFRNNGNWRFTDVTREAGLAELPPTYQAAWADFDNDGDLDLITAGKLFENGGNDRCWLKVRLRGDGKVVNTGAVGSQVRIKAGSRILTRQVEAGTGEGNQNSPVLHFGLGDYQGNIDLTIRWPNDVKQTVSSVDVNSTVTISYDSHQHGF